MYNLNFRCRIFLMIAVVLPLSADTYAQDKDSLLDSLGNINIVVQSDQIRQDDLTEKAADDLFRINVAYSVLHEDGSIVSDNGQIVAGRNGQFKADVSDLLAGRAKNMKSESSVVQVDLDFSIEPNNLFPYAGETSVVLNESRDHDRVVLDIEEDSSEQNVPIQVRIVSSVDGKPIKGLSLRIDGREIVHTNDDGMFSAEVPKSGFHVTSRDLQGSLYKIDRKVDANQVTEASTKGKQIELTSDAPRIVGMIKVRDKSDQGEVLEQVAVDGWLNVKQWIAEDHTAEYSLRVVGGRFALYPPGFKDSSPGQKMQFELGGGFANYIISEGQFVDYPANPIADPHEIELTPLNVVKAPILNVGDAQGKGSLRKIQVLILDDGNNVFDQHLEADNERFQLPAEVMTEKGLLIVRSRGYESRAISWPPDEADREISIVLVPLIRVSIQVAEEVVEESSFTVALRRSNQPLDDVEFSATISNENTSTIFSDVPAGDVDIALFDENGDVVYLRSFDASDEDEIAIEQVEHTQIAVHVDCPVKYRNSIAPILIDKQTTLPMRALRKEHFSDRVKLTAPSGREYLLCLKTPHGWVFIEEIEMSVKHQEKIDFSYDPDSIPESAYYNNMEDVVERRNKPVPGIETGTAPENE